MRILVQPILMPSRPNKDDILLLIIHFFPFLLNQLLLLQRQILLKSNIFLFILIYLVCSSQKPVSCCAFLCRLFYETRLHDALFEEIVAHVHCCFSSFFFSLLSYCIHHQDERRYFVRRAWVFQLFRTSMYFVFVQRLLLLRSHTLKVYSLLFRF